MRHKIFIRSIINCKRCDKKFEKKSRMEKLCYDCWHKSQTRRLGKSGRRVMAKCSICNKSIPGDRINIAFAKRNEEINSSRGAGAWKSNRIYTCHIDCFNKKWGNLK